MPNHSGILNANTDTLRQESPSFFQRLGSFDLLNNLVFNREKVYQSLKRLSPVRTSTVKEEAGRDLDFGSEDRVVESNEYKEEDDEMRLRKDSRAACVKTTDTAASQSRGKTPMKTPAKAKPKARRGVVTTKKRSPPAATQNERASKIRKTVAKANSGKRVNGRGETVTDAFVISDDEDEDSGEIPRDTLTPVVKMDSAGNVDDLEPISTPAPTYSKNVQNELVRMKELHAKEFECLRLQLAALEAELKQAEEIAAQQALNVQRRHNISSDKYRADREEELEKERCRSYDLSWECDHLRRELQAVRSCELELVQQRDEHERLYKAEQDRTAELRRSLEAKDHEATQKATLVADEMQQLAAQIEELQRQVIDLSAENTALGASANATPQPRTEPRPRTDSPASSVSSQSTSASSQSTSASSQSTSAAELRMANMRKTYITVKRRYDTLHSVAVNISTATRGWDCAGFGEFGGYLRQLKMALRENGFEEGAGWGSGGSDRTGMHGRG